ncbi:hypothetical protein PsorP6_007703 [Peronosclerospora sorghi]|uniref:Uncharacterized protein n=1 Tax=Peronosclerospora sorghi TaxID=230839 RepID=A0ACC0W8K6_9STRA|nr:hypothetical protein PsorP6_007703 [Peronosclerospora sorghi]
MNFMSFASKTNTILEIGKRLIQHEEEWKDKCAAFQELRLLLADLSPPKNAFSTASHSERDVVSLFSPENVQALTQPFRLTVTDLRSTVVKEACATLSVLARALGPGRCKILVRDVFPTLLEARGGSNKVSLGSIDTESEEIILTFTSG